MISGLRRVIVSAAPTCTLWRYSVVGDFFIFRFNQRWKISKTEMVEAKGEVK